MKIFGLWNNLAIVEVWMAVLALLVLASEIREWRPFRPDPAGGGKDRPIKIGALATHALVILGLEIFFSDPYCRPSGRRMTGISCSPTP